ncbi:MAG TPA: hypothetical protein VHL98_20350 [Microvirga sp.]|jgi:hypothetical protein|nr:hypothetical protein [Microvirga sp.]
MTEHRSGGPKVPAEHPDPKAAARGGSGQDRPGFDLGGAKGGDNATGVGSSTIPGGPRSSPGAGTTTGLGDGATDTSGSRSSGNRGDAGSGAGSGPTDGSGGPG